MKQALDQLKEFHRVFRAAARDTVGVPDAATIALRAQLMREELDETITAMQQDDLVEIADGLADLCYVAIGTAVAYGIPLDKVFEEVHRSNMMKAPNGIVKYREDGKVLKPEGWQPPNVKSILFPGE